MEPENLKELAENIAFIDALRDRFLFDIVLLLAIDGIAAAGWN